MNAKQINKRIKFLKSEIARLKVGNTWLCGYIIKCYQLELSNLENLEGVRKSLRELNEAIEDKKRQAKGEKFLKKHKKRH